MPAFVCFQWLLRGGALVEVLVIVLIVVVVHRHHIVDVKLDVN